MNYIQQVNGFWAKAETDDLTGNDIAVYFAILKYCNSLNWLNPFICHWHIICQYSKVSKNTYYKCIERLNNLNYIIFKKGERSKSMPKITVLEFENNKGTIKEQEGNTEGTRREQEGNLYKLLNNKTIKLINDNYKIVNSKIESWIESENNSDLIQSIYELKKDYLENERLVEAVLSARDFPFNDRFDLEKKLSEFCEHLRSVDETTKKEKDFKRHFLNWSRKQKEKSSAKKEKDYLQMEDLIIPSTNQNQLK